VEATGRGEILRSAQDDEARRPEDEARRQIVRHPSSILHHPERSEGSAKSAISQAPATGAAAQGEASRKFPQTWRQLVEGWRTSKPLQARKLEEVHCVEFSSTKLVLVVSEDSFVSKSLLLRDEQLRIQEQFRELFGFAGSLQVMPKGATDTPPAKVSSANVASGPIAPPPGVNGAPSTSGIRLGATREGPRAEGQRAQAIQSGRSGPSGKPAGPQGASAFPPGAQRGARSPEPSEDEDVPPPSDYDADYGLAALPCGEARGDSHLAREPSPTPTAPLAPQAFEKMGAVPAALPDTILTERSREAAARREQLKREALEAPFTKEVLAVLGGTVEDIRILGDS
jgi:hypothetical protein